MTLLPCRECGHSISDSATLCPNCGASLNDAEGDGPSPPSAIQAATFLTHWLAEQAKTAVGLAGSTMLGLGVFMPYASVPFAGSVTIFHSGWGWGVGLLVIAVCAFLTIYSRIPLATLVLAVLACVLLTINLVRFNDAREWVREEATAQGERLDQLLPGIPGFPSAADTGRSIASGFTIQWGVGFMVVGTLLILVSTLPSETTASQAIHTARTRTGAALARRREVVDIRRVDLGNPKPGFKNAEEHDFNEMAKEMFSVWLKDQNLTVPLDVQTRARLYNEFRQKLLDGRIDTAHLRSK